MLDLINEFLLFYKMDYTQSVFLKETNILQNIAREKLVKNLALKENIDPDKPVLMHIVTQYLKGMVGSIGTTVFGGNTKKNEREEEDIGKGKIKKEQGLENNNFVNKKNNNVSDFLRGF